MIMTKIYKVSYWMLSSAIFLLFGLLIFEEAILQNRKFYHFYICIILFLNLIGMAPLIAIREKQDD